MHHQPHQSEQHRHFSLSTPFFVKVPPRPNKRPFIGRNELGEESHVISNGRSQKRRYVKNVEIGSEVNVVDSQGSRQEQEVQEEETSQTRHFHHADTDRQLICSPATASLQQVHNVILVSGPGASSPSDKIHPSAHPLPSSSSLVENPNLRSFAHRPRHFYRSRSGGVSSIQQLLKFDPNQCFDIDELRSRMLASQRKIEDLCSLNLNNVKLKQENGQLREELMKCDNRITQLESMVLERNQRLKELLRENVFMRAQFKKVQNEFGVEAVKEVFNQNQRI